MSKILTIVIPTYNMEKYLRHGLTSLLVPNKDDMEVLIVNDGSKDTSSAIGHEFQDRYPETFRVIDKENGNYGSCINRGLKEATGKYIRVLDADDTYEKDGLEKLIDTLKDVDADLVITDYRVVDENDHVTRIKSLSGRCPDVPQREVFDFPSFVSRPDVSFLGAMHGFTYRTQMLRDMNYHQTEGISYTDQEWVTMPVSRVKTCYYLPVYVYRYLVGRAGQTMKMSAKQIDQSIRVFFNVVDFYEQNGIAGTAYKKYFMNLISMGLEATYFQGVVKESIPFDVITKFDERLKAYSDLYTYSDTLGRYGFKFIRQWHKAPTRPLSPLTRHTVLFAEWLHDVKYKLKYL